MMPSEQGVFSFCPRCEARAGLCYRDSDGGMYVLCTTGTCDYRYAVGLDEPPSFV